MDTAIYPGEIEIRQIGGRPTVSMAFPYGRMATIADRGTVRKERFSSRAFRYAVDDPDREITVLRGHNFSDALGSKHAGNATFKDGARALEVELILPLEAEQTIAQVDTLKQIQQGLVRGISPGFRVPPTSTVPDAVSVIPEPGNPGVMIREVHEALLVEMSLVVRPAYSETTVAIRSDHQPDADHLELYRWL